MSASIGEDCRAPCSSSPSLLSYLAGAAGADGLAALSGAHPGLSWCRSRSTAKARCAFLLDTGSSRSAISETLALQLGARPVGQTKVLTPSGRVTRLLTPLPRLTVDGSVPVPSLAMIVPDQDLARGVRAVGIIGADVLARFALTIDYANLRIVWRAVDAVPGSIVLPLAALRPTDGLRAAPVLRG